MRRVVITGMGIISPVGNDINTFWKNLKEGHCGIDKITAFYTDDTAVKFAGEVKNFNADDYNVDKAIMRRSDRYAQFALAATAQAMQDSQLKIEPERLGVYIGSGIGGIQTFSVECKKLLEEGINRVSPLFIPMMIPNIAAGNVAIVNNAEGPCLPVVTACATGTHSIGEAFHAIKHGYADAIITGGAEAAITPIAIGGFNNSRALSRSTDPLQASTPFDKERQGFVIGEGAGIIILEEYEHAQKRNAKIYAEVVGYGNSCDAYHYTAPKPDGYCAANAIKTALKEANYQLSESLYINAHGTGTPLNDKSETTAIKIALGDEKAAQTPISSTKSMTGHMLGAAGGAEVIASALTLYDGIIPPTIGLHHPDPECDLDYVPLIARQYNADIALSNSLGFGGHNACIALRKIN